MSGLEKMMFQSRLPPRRPDGMPGSRCLDVAFKMTEKECVCGETGAFSEASVTNDSRGPGAPGGRRGNPGKRTYTPIQWNQYFNASQDVVCGENTFRVYTAGTVGPVLVLLHGGGFSALTWSLFTASVIEMVECRVVAVDLRGHGDSVTTNDADLSAETMASDVGAIINSLYDNDAPPIILIGHSMGGAVAVRTAVGNHIPSLIGLAVIDVVEGTALDALASMQSFLRSRPKQFKSLENAIEWCVRSGQVRNVESARVSMPGQIKNIKTGKLATNDLATYVPSETEPERFTRLNSDAISEDAESTDCSSAEFVAPLGAVGATHNYTWRIDLGQTEKYWPGWFKGLSSAFLECHVPKMLLLAGIDRLDRDLTVGQMQGKFQMQVLPACGHAVHEDVPDKVAETLATFMVRNKFAEAASNFQRSVPAC